MQWTDRIRQVKIFLVVAAILIAVASLLVSHSLAHDLSDQERSKMQVWAEAMKSLSAADENTDLSLVLKVLDENHTIPVVVLDNDGVVTEYRNIIIKARNAKDSVNYVTSLGQQLKASGQVIRISLSKNHNDYIDVCYDDSLMLKRIALTPISSLMAWTTILKETYPDDELLPEMDKDVKRLQLIADRFSKIGSVPEPVPSSLNQVLNHVVDYMDRRTSKKIEMKTELPADDIIINMNASLFEWVIENLCKNAVDAMGGKIGSITLRLEETDKRAIVEVSDTGKGIKKKDIRNVFRPGFTTKERGWGLGLSLAKRIVEEYHHGKICVKSSEVGKGTTFRIELRKA